MGQTRFNDVRADALTLTPKVVRKSITVALTAAQIIALHSAPVTIIPAPATGKAVFVESCIVSYSYGTVQMTGGGAVNPVYHGATTNLLSGSVAAATIQAAASAVVSCGAPVAALTLTPATAVDLYAASADFAAGDGTATVNMQYTIVG